MKSRLDEDFDDEEDEVDEINIYINKKPTNKEMDILAWWKAHQTQYPCLACMACDYLAIPPTFTTSERLFSSGQNMITDKRCRLAQKLLGQVNVFDHGCRDH